jgi:NitT/TauT family transport system permease protein
MTRRSWLTTSPAAAVILPIVGLIGAIALWWVATIVFAIEPYLLPSPGDVVAKILEQPGVLLAETWTSLLETLEGFLLAIVVGVPIALVIVRSVILERLVYPLLLMVNSIPKVAVAPLLVIWMGFGQWP